MNIFGAVVFFTLVFTFLVKLLSELLNLKASEAPLPDEFTGVFDEDAYRKSREYLRVSTVFSLFEAALDLSVLFLFWFLGGFNLLDHFLRGVRVKSSCYRCALYRYSFADAIVD